MTGLQYWLWVLKVLVWPPKGVIYLEEQLLQLLLAWIIAYAKVFGSIIIMIIGIVLLFRSIGIRGLHRPGAPFIERFLQAAGRTIVNILFAWGFLLIGAIGGRRAEQVDADRYERETTGTYQYRRQVTRNTNVTYSFTRTSVHFRLGRWIYRLFWNLLGHVPVVRQNARVHEVLARLLTLVVILWGVWHIPYDLTH